MKKLMIILACVSAHLAFAEPETGTAVTSACDKSAVCSDATVRERREAQRYGHSLEEWRALSKNKRRTIRREARAKAKGMTVEEMKAEANRKGAEKAGCPVEQWSKMSVRQRQEYRRNKAQEQKEKAAQAAAETK